MDRRMQASTERGGITIVVALMLLVLLTVAAFAMSRNSLREVLIAGTVRQAADVRSYADNGCEFAIYYLGQNTERPVPAAGTGAAWVVGQSEAVQTEGQVNQGKWFSLTGSGKSDLELTFDRGKKWVDLKMSYMGKLAQDKTSDLKDVRASSQIQPDLFCVRTTAKVAYTSGPTFAHKREIWATVPIRN